LGGSPIVAIIASVFLGLLLYMRMDLRTTATTSGMKGNMTTALRATGTSWITCKKWRSHFLSSESDC